MTGYAPYKPGKRRYRITLQAKKSASDLATNDLKRLVKRLARSFGFRLVEIKDVTNGGPPQ